MNVSKHIVMYVLSFVLFSTYIDSAYSKNIIIVDSVVDALSFSSNGNILAAGSQDAVIRFWEVPKMVPILKDITSDCPVHSVSFFQNHKIILTQGSLLPMPFGIDFQVWDIETGLRLTKKLGPVKEGSQRAALAPDQKSMAVIRYIDAPQPFICELVRFNANEVIKLPVSTIDNIYRLEAIAYSPDGKTVAASGIVSKKGDWVVLIWDTSVRPIKEKHIRWWMPRDPGGLETTQLAFSSDGRYLATGHYFNTVRVIEINSNKVIRNMAGGGGHMLFINRPVATLLVSDVKHLFLWSPPMPDMKNVYQSKVPLVLCMAAHPNGHTIALGGYGETNIDGDVRIEGDPRGMIELYEVK